MLDYLFYKYELFRARAVETNYSTNIIEALLLLYNEHVCAKQLMPILREIKWIRLSIVAEDILDWTIRQEGYLKLSSEERLHKYSPDFWHIGVPRTVVHEIGCKPFVREDILLVLSAFHGDDNYFIADEKEFEFAPSVSITERIRISKRVVSEWRPRGFFSGGS